MVARFEHLPLARFFFSRTGEREFSDRLARAIVKEANYLQVEPSLLAGVLLTFAGIALAGRRPGQSRSRRPTSSSESAAKATR